MRDVFAPETQLMDHILHRATACAQVRLIRIMHMFGFGAAAAAASSRKQPQAAAEPSSAAARAVFGTMPLRGAVLAIIQLETHRRSPWQAEYVVALQHDWPRVARSRR